MNVLLVDDQSKVRSAIRLLLEQQPDWNIVDEACNISELLNHVEHYCPDVLLLDWELPGYSVEKLIRKLRSLCSDLFIIVLDSNPQTRQPALEAGANEFVSKNDPPERLLDTIISFKNIAGYQHHCF